MPKFIFAAAMALIASSLLSTSASAQVPPGSYRQTCSNIRFDGEMLSAVCADRFGRGVPTQLMVGGCAGGISNNGGRLVCEGGGRYGGGGDDYPRGRPRRDYDDDGFRGPRLPGGSWRASCTNASMRGPILVAACANARGGYQQTSADVRQCPSFANRNGGLVCE